MQGRLTDSEQPRTTLSLHNTNGITKSVSLAYLRLDKAGLLPENWRAMACFGVLNEVLDHNNLASLTEDINRRAIEQAFGQFREGTSLSECKLAIDTLAALNDPILMKRFAEILLTPKLNKEICFYIGQRLIERRNPFAAEVAFKILAESKETDICCLAVFLASQVGSHTQLDSCFAQLLLTSDRDESVYAAVALHLKGTTGKNLISAALTVLARREVSLKFLRSNTTIEVELERKLIAMDILAKELQQRPNKDIEALVKRATKSRYPQLRERAAKTLEDLVA